MLLRLDSKKHANGQRDHITVEVVGGFMAVTMQLSSKSRLSSPGYLVRVI